MLIIIVDSTPKTMYTVIKNGFYICIFCIFIMEIKSYRQVKPTTHTCKSDISGSNNYFTVTLQNSRKDDKGMQRYLITVTSRFQSVHDVASKMLSQDNI
jgi:hypothetical protein